MILFVLFECANLCVPPGRVSGFAEKPHFGNLYKNALDKKCNRSFHFNIFCLVLRKLHICKALYKMLYRYKYNLSISYLTFFYLKKNYFVIINIIADRRMWCTLLSCCCGTCRVAASSWRLRPSSRHTRAAGTRFDSHA